MSEHAGGEERSEIRLKRALGWLVSWALYGIGYPLYWLNRWVWWRFYRPWNAVMLASADVQCWGGGPGPWINSAGQKRCDRCLKMFCEDELIPQEGDEWECPPCFTRCDAQERAGTTGEGHE